MFSPCYFPIFAHLYDLHQIDLLTCCTPGGTNALHTAIEITIALAKVLETKRVVLSEPDLFSRGFNKSPPPSNVKGPRERREFAEPARK